MEAECASLGLLELLDALSDREVFLCVVLAHDKEAARLVKLWVCTYFEVGKVRQFLITPIVEAYDLLDERFVIAVESLPVLFQIENGTTLRLYLINVEVVDASDLVACLRALHILLLLHVSHFSGLFGHSQFVLDAEVVVAALGTPELFQGFTLELRKFKALLLDGNRRRYQLVYQIRLESQIRNSKMTAECVTAGVREF